MVAKGADQKPSQFLDRYIDIWPLVMKAEHVQKIVTCKSKWKDIKNELHQVCTSSSLGNRLFGFAQKQVLGEQVDETIDTCMKDLMMKGTQLLTGEDVLKCKRLCMQRVEAIPDVSRLPDRREISYQYRKVHITVKISCIGEQIDYKIWGYVEGLAVFCKVLTPMLAEDQLVKCMLPGGAEVYAIGMTVEESLVAESETARVHLNKMAELGKTDDSAAVQVDGELKSTCCVAFGCSPPIVFVKLVL